MSTLNENGATSADVAPKLDVRCELDRREAPPTASRVPRRARTLRVAVVVAGLLAVLGIGWGAGLKSRDQMSTWFQGSPGASVWFQETAGVLQSYLETQGKSIVVGIAALASPSASPDPSSPERLPDEIGTAERIERSADALAIKMDLLRVSSATVISELSRGFEHLNGSVERGQRELLAKLDQLQDRVGRLEQQLSTASTRGQAQPAEQPPAPKNGPPPSQGAAPPAATGAPKPATPPPQPKRVENWAVREVVDGMAILAGPSGIIGVVNGDIVPGVGRVESISRRGGRWQVGTSRGVITDR
jgi:hypothetical protein